MDWKTLIMQNRTLSKRIKMYEREIEMMKQQIQNNIEALEEAILQEIENAAKSVGPDNTIAKASKVETKPSK